MRESPGIKIIDLLIKKQFNVYFSDPYITKIPKLRNYDLKTKRVNINSKTLKKFDLIVLSTDHDNFNYKLIYNNSSLILDTRNVFKEDKKNKVIQSYS